VLLGEGDIVRHQLVKDIVNAYEGAAAKKKREGG